MNGLKGVGAKTILLNYLESGGVNSDIVTRAMVDTCANKFTKLHSKPIYKIRLVSQYF